MRATRAQQRFTRALASALEAPGTLFHACAQKVMKHLWRYLHGDVNAIAEHLETSTRSVQRYLVASGVRPRNAARINKRYRRRARRTRR